MYLILVLAARVATSSGAFSSDDLLEIQDQYRQEGIRSANDRDLAVIPGDDDHVWSSSPTESTNAPTPSGTADISFQCLSQCTDYDATNWNLDNWCKFYWDSGCYLPDTNYLNIAPAGKAEVGEYACVPSCLQSSRCGPAYCKTFSHLSSSCRTGYAHLLFNSTLQDETHDKCIAAFISNMFDEQQTWGAYSPAKLHHYVWQAVFTITPISYDNFMTFFDINSLIIRSSTAHILSGVSVSNIHVVEVSDAAVATPTQQPTSVSDKPTWWPSPAPTVPPTPEPSEQPTFNKSTYCDTPLVNHWCNSNQDENIYLGLASDAQACQELCNAYMGVSFTEGCCQWYRGNTEVLYEYTSCSLQPDGQDTVWDDHNTYWSGNCHSVSAYPSHIPTEAPTLGSGENGKPTAAPSEETPLPTLSPTPIPSTVPTPAPSFFIWSEFPTQAPTVPTHGTRITVQINTTMESLGLPLLSKEEAYAQLRDEFAKSFESNGYLDSLKLANTWYNGTLDVPILEVNELTTSLPGFDADSFPTAAPTSDNGTPAPTPTYYFENMNNTLNTNEDDNIAAIAGGSAAAVVGVGAAGTAAYQYGASNLVKVGAEPEQGLEVLELL